MSSTSRPGWRKVQERFLYLTFRSMRILINDGNRKLTYTKNWPFFALSCLGVRNGNTKQERGVVNGGNTQLSESYCLQKSSREEGELATAAEASEEPSGILTSPLLERHRTLHVPLAPFLWLECLLPSLTGEFPRSLQNPTQTTPIWWWLP